MKTIIKIFTVLSLIFVCQSYCVNSFADEINEKNIIWNAEFDGNDDMSAWGAFINGNPVSLPSGGYLEDGNIKLSRENGFQYRSFGAVFDDYIDFTGKSDISFEFRFMHTGDGGLYKNMFEILSDSKQSFVNLPVNNGELYYGAGQAGESGTGTGVILEKDKWYTVKLNINFVTYQYGITVSGDDIDEVTMKPVNFVYNRKASKLWKFMMFPILAAADSETHYIDYIRICDNSYRVTDSSVKDGDENVRTDSDISVETSWKAADDAVFDSIKITDKDGNAAEREVAATDSGFDIKFPAGLKYGEKYTLTCGDGVMSENGKKLEPYSMEFSTEDKPLYVTQPEVREKNGKIISEVRAANYTTDTIKVYLFNAVYASGGMLVKLNVKEEELPSGTAEKTITNTLDVSDTENYTYRSFRGYIKE